MKINLSILLIFIPFILTSQVKFKGEDVYHKGVQVSVLAGEVVEATPTCSDGIQNGDETGVDCGGSCDPCSGDPPVADFSASDTTPLVSQNVTFLDASTNTPTSWAWTFTGGTPSSSTVQNPIVTYSTVGTYTVSLTATNADGSDGETKTGYITVSEAIGTCSPGTPTSVTTLAGLTGATPGSTVQIDGSISATGATFAANLVVVSGSGTISGTNINLNGACINEDYGQIFSNSVTFSALYANSRLSPETFGANGGDATADDVAIATLVAQSQYATGNPSSVYIKNAESIYNRSGTFDWDMNGSIVRTTSAAALSHGTAASNESKYMMRFQLDNLVIKNGEFDGQDLVSRLILVDDPVTFELDSLTIHDILSPANAYARGVALKFHIYGSNLVSGSITNLDIDNVGATSDGIANNTPFGVSKAFYFEVFDNGGTPAYITMSGNNINNVYGDDAEGFINAGGWGGSYNYTTNNVWWDMDNETYTACERRAFKLNASNVDMNNMNITSVSTAPSFGGAQATLIHVFSISSSAPIDDITLTNSTITRTGSSQNILFGVNDAKDVLIDNNTWNAQSALDLYGFVGFGNDIDQGGLYSGDLDNVDFTNNTLNNVGILINPNFLDITGGGLTIDTNVMDFDVTSYAGGHSGMILIYDLNGGSESVPVTISNLSITANLQSAGSSLWGGVIKSRQNGVQNLTLDNVDVTWTGSAPYYNFGHFLSNFGSTNTIINCDITGRSGTNAIVVDGATQNPVITNSFGDGATPITVQ